MTTHALYTPPKKPRGLLKRGFKLPIALYRVRLGWLLGHRFLQLTHRGRKTSAIRQTVLEVVHYDAATNESAVVSAYGAKADWYQNIQASPPIEVRTARSHFTPQYRLLDPSERFTVLDTYQRRYRHAFRAVIRFLGYDYDGSEVSLRALADQVLIVGFRPRQESTHR